MLYDRFFALAQQYNAIYDEYGNDKVYLEGVGIDNFVCDKWHMAYLHSAINTINGTSAYNLFEPIPVFDDLISFLEQVSPQITALHLQKLYDLIDYHPEKEEIGGYTKYHINCYISIETVYQFLQRYRYV